MEIDSKHMDIMSISLPTIEETSYFIKNFESFLKGSISLESLLKSYPFLKEIDMGLLRKDFSKTRTFLLSRKKIKIYTPITISNNLIKILYPIFSNISKSNIILDPIQDSSIVAGIKFNLDGKIFDLTLDSLNKIKDN